MANEYISDLMKEINQSLFYIGSQEELPKNGNIGDVCIVSGITYLFTGNRWDEIGTDIPDTYPTMIKHPTHCKCCGAILHSNKCEYCGAEYFEENVV